MYWRFTTRRNPVEKVPGGRRPESLSRDSSSRALSRSPSGVAGGSSCATASAGGGASFSCRSSLFGDASLFVGTSLFVGGTSPSGTFWSGSGSIAGSSGRGSCSVMSTSGIGSGSTASSLYSGTSVLLFLEGFSPSTVEDKEEWSQCNHVLFFLMVRLNIHVVRRERLN